MLKSRIKSFNKKKHIHYMLIFSSIVISFNALSQNYESGSIVLNNGDTLSGFIKYKNWSHNPKSISFKKTLSDEKIILTPNQVDLFTVKNDIYCGRTMDIEDSPRVTDILNDSKVDVYRKDSVFLRLLIKGHTSLYYLKDHHDVDHYFIRIGSGKIDELIYRVYLDKVTNPSGPIPVGSMVKRESFKYRGQLAYHFKDQKSLSDDIQKLEYKRKHMVSIFEKYNSFYNKGQLEYKIEKEKPIFVPYVFAGMTISKINFTSFHEYLDIPEFEKSQDVTFGLALDIILPRNHRKISFYNELSYRSFSTSAQYYEEISNNQENNYDISLDFAYISWIIMARYRFSKGKVKPFIGSGISNSYAFKSENILLKTTKLFGNSSYQTLPAIEHLKTFTTGFLVSLGCNYRFITAEVRYELTNGISNSLGTGSSLNFLTTLVSINF